MTGTLVYLDRTHLDDAVNVLSKAFMQDPMITYILSSSRASHQESLASLFTFSCEVRLLLDWPLLGVFTPEGVLAGVAGITLPGEAVWPEELQKVYNHFKEVVGPDSASLLETYSVLADTNRPAEPHYQLGVIGVDPLYQGMGYGSTLIRALHQLSSEDASSIGVWLDTETMQNVVFYKHHGYEVRAENVLGGIGIWGMFRPDPPKS